VLCSVVINSISNVAGNVPLHENRFCTGTSICYKFSGTEELISNWQIHRKLEYLCRCQIAYCSMFVDDVLCIVTCLDNQVLVNRTQSRISIERGSRQDAAWTLWRILYTCPALHRNSCSSDTEVSFYFKLYIVQYVWEHFCCTSISAALLLIFCMLSTVCKVVN